MQLLISGYEGGEEVLKQEIKETLNVNSKTEPSVAIFEVKDMKDYAKLAYLGQSFSLILELIDSFEFRDFEEFSKKVSKTISDPDFSFLKNKTFKVDCTRIGNHDFSSVDVWPAVGDPVVDKIKDVKVDLRNPQIIIHVYIYNNKAYIGINHVGFEIDKRDYKVYSHRLSIKGNLGYTILKLADYTGKESVLDPFPHDGTIMIEAAFIKSKLPINYFRKEKFKFVKDGIIDIRFLENLDEERAGGEKISKSTVDVENDKENKKQTKTIFAFDSELRNIKAMKSNAKIGGVNESVEFSRVDAEWIDLKFEKESLDLIVSNPDKPGQRTEKSMPKRYKETLYNAKYALKKDGKIVVITNDKFREIAETEGFSKDKTIELKKGGNNIYVDVFVKD